MMNIPAVAPEGAGRLPGGVVIKWVGHVRDWAAGKQKLREDGAVLLVRIPAATDATPGFYQTRPAVRVLPECLSRTGRTPVLAKSR